LLRHKKNPRIREFSGFDKANAYELLSFV
jgi:hypothetical protein